MVDVVSAAIFLADEQFVENSRSYVGKLITLLFY